MRPLALRALATTAATTLAVVAFPTLAARADTTTQTGSCVDESGQTWTSKVVWGDEYTDSAGVQRVRVDYAGWTTDAVSLGTDSAVRTFDGDGGQLRDLQWTGSFDYKDGTNWRSRDPRNPPSDPGSAKVTITLGVDGDGKGDCTSSFVQPSESTSTSDAVAAVGGGGWASTQSGVPVGDAGCSSASGTATANALRKEWDYWDVCGGAVVSASAEGLPTQPEGGDHVFRWSKPAGASNVYQKLNRTLTKDNWPGGSAGPVPNTGSPSDVSGTYTVWQYIPSARFKLNPRHGWVILSEFKENYTDNGGGWHQEATWGLGCDNFSGGTQCALTPHSPTFALAPYLDQWVKWEYRIYQGSKDSTGHGGRIELWANGTLLDTGYEAQRHVGSAAFSSLGRTQAFVWIAGQYSSNQTTNGAPDYQGTDITSYIGRSSISSR